MRKYLRWEKRQADTGHTYFAAFGTDNVPCGYVVWNEPHRAYLAESAGRVLAVAPSIREAMEHVETEVLRPDSGFVRLAMLPYAALAGLALSFLAVL